MAWYPDLSTYRYRHGSPPMLNVGWLEEGRAFNTGGVPPEFTVQLRKLAQQRANLCKGFHFCDLCSRPDDAHPEDSIDRFMAWSKGRSGNGEIHVRSAAGIVYSAPVLIVHYVEVHAYCPPQEFIDAVLATASGNLDSDGEALEGPSTTAPSVDPIDASFAGVEDGRAHGESGTESFD